MGVCPYDCENKTEFGYCKNTGCINPKYIHIVFHTNSNNTYRTPCENCPNNPKNGGSGICHCVLGNKIIY